MCRGVFSGAAGAREGASVLELVNRIPSDLQGLKSLCDNYGFGADIAAVPVCFVPPLPGLGRIRCFLPALPRWATFCRPLRG